MKNQYYEQRARILKAMAHPSRLMIIESLADGEKCVNELRQIVGSDISTVSRHLALLRNSGIVDDRKDGLRVFYRLRCPCILEFFTCVESVLEEAVKLRLTALESTARL